MPARPHFLKATVLTKLTFQNSNPAVHFSAEVQSDDLHLLNCTHNLKYVEWSYHLEIELLGKNDNG
ncbi:MAG: hypothetical protein ACJAYB_003139 [Psychromonas sp.]|jgi:hypothetical protein